jgi:hypothetical protein
MIQLTRSGTRGADAREELDVLREQFRRQLYVRLPQLLPPAELQFVQTHLDRTPLHERLDFYPETDEPWACELSTKSGPAFNLLHFLANDAAFFQIVQYITGCAPIGCFLGRIYRVVPGCNHYDTWHHDLGHHRMITLTINLSRTVYAGGVLQIRRVGSDDVVEVPNTGFGDAVLFPLAEALEHRITDMVGEHPKTAFAGWFRSRPDYYEMLRKGAGKVVGARETS